MPQIMIFRFLLRFIQSFPLPASMQCLFTFASPYLNRITGYGLSCQHVKTASYQ